MSNTLKVLDIYKLQGNNLTLKKYIGDFKMKKNIVLSLLVLMISMSSFIYSQETNNEITEGKEY